MLKFDEDCSIKLICLLVVCLSVGNQNRKPSLIWENYTIANLIKNVLLSNILNFYESQSTWAVKIKGHKKLNING